MIPIRQHTVLTLLIVLLGLLTGLACVVASSMLGRPGVSAPWAYAAMALGIALLVVLAWGLNAPLVSIAKEGRTRLGLIVETAAEGIITIGPYGHIETVNPAAERIFGYRPEQLRGRSLATLLSARYQEVEDGDFQDFLERNAIQWDRTEPREIEQVLTGLRRDGATFPLELSVVSAEIGGHRMYTAMVRDITERLRAEEQLRQARDQLEQRVRERTAELETLNARLQAEMAERLQAQKALSQANNALEERVARRTRDLQYANKNLQDEISERIRIQEELRQARDKLELRVAERTQELRKTNTELQQAIDKIKTLRGLIPICAECKKVRDDKGYWNQIESYLTEHSDADFSHGICPDCVRKLYPGITLDS